jgi:hypothetical protein
MDLRLTPQHLKFRDELRAWLKANIARPWREELRDPKHTEDSLIQLRRTGEEAYKAGYRGRIGRRRWPRRPRSRSRFDAGVSPTRRRS